MEIRNSFDVPLPPERAWPVLLDIPRIVHCVPGAELTEKIDERTYKGRVAVKLGPIGLLFNGTAQFEDVDDQAHTAVVRAQGSDAKGRGGANSTVRFSLSPAAGGTRVDVVTDVALSGMVAQYGRGTGLIQGVATQLVNQFATSLRALLAKEQSQADAGSAFGEDAVPDASKQAPTRPINTARDATDSKPISGFSLIFGAIQGALAGLFRRR